MQAQSTIHERDEMKTMHTDVKQSAAAEHGVDQASVSEVGEKSAASIALQRLADGAAAYEGPQSLLRRAKASPERLHDEYALHGGCHR